MKNITLIAMENSANHGLGVNFCGYQLSVSDPDARDVGRSCAQVTQKHMSFDVEIAKAVSSQILYQEQQVTFSRSVYRQNLTNMNPEKKHFWNLPINTNVIFSDTMISVS